MLHLHIRISVVCSLIGLLMAFTTPLIARAAYDHDGCQDVAQAVRAKYESLLPSLELEEQRHFAVRLYRMTGDSKYVGPVVADLRRAVGELERDLEGKANARYIERRTDALLADFHETTRKGRQRKRLFKKKREMLFALNVLTNAKRMAEHRSTDVAPDTLLQAGIEYLQEVDLTQVLLNKAVIRVYSPQAVNFVYYLNDLGISDLRPQYTDAFRKVFPDDHDAKLSKYEFRDKVYGLTHFILAASDYYQHYVDSTDVEWILDYFADHIDRILIETTSDIIAEVGVCFLLAREDQHPVVRRCQSQICQRIDPDSHMLLSPHGSDDVEKGEHRNILAYMLLNWPDTLYPGPYLPSPN